MTVVDHAAAALPPSFAGKVADPSGCIQWIGAIASNGYGSISVGGVVTTAHRAAWEHVNGPVPDGLQIDHLCRNRACVNVKHMELVTSAENTARQPRNVNFRPGGECAKGHAITSIADIYVRSRGKRECVQCRRLSHAARRAAAKAAS